MRILVASQISPVALEELAKHHEIVEAVNQPEDVLEERIAGCHALLFRSGVQITADVMAASPDLQLVVRAGSGIDNIDLDYVAERGIALARVPGPGARAVAEMTFALMLGLARQMLPADRALREGRWTKYQVRGHLLHGKTLGVYGAGNIGSRVARMGVAWGMRVLACVEENTPERRREFAEEGITLASPETLLSEGDFVTLHVPLNDETRGLIGREELARMKPSAFLVTLARGGVVDEAALLEALEAGELAGAGLDVHENEGEGHVSPLAHRSDVILTPHIGATTVDTQDIIGARIVEIVEEFQPA
ncbi:MAG: NAD(P)-dependent oxidoreductase [Longimicrobiales bacterium]|nr:NAD(P)-dependent oxidoreductase [Longimicrobiales bacterium]